MAVAAKMTGILRPVWLRLCLLPAATAYLVAILQPAIQLGKGYIRWRSCSRRKCHLASGG